MWIEYTICSSSHLWVNRSVISIFWLLCIVLLCTCMDEYWSEPLFLIHLRPGTILRGVVQGLSQISKAVATKFSDSPPETVGLVSTNVHHVAGWMPPNGPRWQPSSGAPACFLSYSSFPPLFYLFSSSIGGHNLSRELLSPAGRSLTPRFLHLVQQSIHSPEDSDFELQTR